MINISFNLKWLIVTVISIIALLCLTHLPPQLMPTAGISVKGLDKLVHFTAYSGITFLFILSLQNRISAASIAIVFASLATLGIADELTQPFVNRTASVWDYLADILGISIMLFFSYNYFSSRNKISE